MNTADHAPASAAGRTRWVVINQSQTPAFQRLIAGLAEQLGPCVEYTGSPFHPAPSGLTLVRGPAYDRRGKVRRAVSWARFLAGAAFLLVKTRGVPFLFATTNPPFLVHLLWLASRLTGSRYGLLIWDLYPDHVVQVGWAGARNPLVRLWRALNRRAFQSAEVVITLGDSMAAAVRSQLDGGDARIVVIPNWADVEELRPVRKEQNPFAQAHGQVGKLTVMYSGNLGATHGVEVIAELAGELRDVPGVALLVVGSGLGRRRLETLVRERGLQNVEFLDHQSPDVFPLSQATADVSLVLQVPGTEHLSVPSKTYSCMAAGSAVLALTSPSSDLARLVVETGAGAVCPMAAPGEAAARIREWLAYPERLSAARVAARRAAEEQFSASVAHRHFAQVLGAAMDTGDACS